MIAALYCTVEGDFEAFDLEVSRHLRRGFFLPAIGTALTTLEGLKAALNFSALILDRTLAAPIRLLINSARKRPTNPERWPNSSIVRRRASRTTILRRTFEYVFAGKKLGQLRSDRPKLFIVACELRAKAAFYFTSTVLHCWRYGSSPASDLPVAHAVTASAAYPLALPALDQEIRFERNGVTADTRVTLTDGGVYDNLGLAPFWPNRDPSISLMGPDVDRLIVCRAGYGLKVGEPASLLLARMSAVFECIFARSENAGIARLFDRSRASKEGAFIMPYLGQDDTKLANAPDNLVSKQYAEGYPTNFSAMSDAWIDRIVTRGEQLTIALLHEHWPELMQAD